MSNQKEAEPPPVDSNKMIEMLAYLELSVNKGNFDAVYLLSEDASIMQKEEKPNMAINMEILRSIMIQASKIAPNLTQLVLNYQKHTVICQPLGPMKLKGGTARIPDVSYIIAVLPPTRTFQKVVNDLIRQLYSPFIFREKKAKKKEGMEDFTKKRLAGQVLKDLDDF